MNSQSFSPNECKEGLHLDLINYLLSYNEKSNEAYYDIHITSDGYCTVIEWENVVFDLRDCSGSFEFVDEGECVMKEVRLPDDSSIMLFKFEDTNKYIENWKKEHNYKDTEEVEELPF